MPWYNKVRNYFRAKTCQYTYEENERMFAVVHIPSCVPFIAAFAWKFITPIPNRNVNALLQNLWAAQLNLNVELLNIQRLWEENFWNNDVRKGGNNFQNEGFQEEYWITKSADRYPLVRPNGTIYEPTGANGMYNGADLEAWLNL
jgi:hypothetical protein